MEGGRAKGRARGRGRVEETQPLQQVPPRRPGEPVPIPLQPQMVPFPPFCYYFFFYYYSIIVYLTGIHVWKNVFHGLLWLFGSAWGRMSIFVLKLR